MPDPGDKFRAGEEGGVGKTPRQIGIEIDLAREELLKCDRRADFDRALVPGLAQFYAEALAILVGCLLYTSDAADE